MSLLGDLYEEEQILSWLMTQKDPGGDVIEDIEGQRLIDLIEESGSMAIYFCKCDLIIIKTNLKKKKLSKIYVTLFTLNTSEYKILCGKRIGN